MMEPHGEAADYKGNCGVSNKRDEVLKIGNKRVVWMDKKKIENKNAYKSRKQSYSGTEKERRHQTGNQPE